MTVKELLKRWMLAYVYKPFFYLPFKEGEEQGATYARLDFGYFDILSYLIIGVYDRYGNLICCSHYKDGSGNYVINSDVVYRSSRRYYFDIIKLPYLTTRYESSVYQGKEFLELPNAKYYVKVMRAGYRYAPTNELNMYEFVVNALPQQQRVLITYQIDRIAAYESVVVRAKCHAGLIPRTTYTRSEIGNIPTTESEDVIVHSYVPYYSDVMEPTLQTYDAGLYCELFYVKTLDGVDKEVIGSKMLKFGGETERTLLASPQGNTDTHTSVLHAIYSSETNVTLDYYSLSKFIEPLIYSSYTINDLYVLMIRNGTDIVNLNVDTSVHDCNLTTVSSSVCRITLSNTPVTYGWWSTSLPETFTVYDLGGQVIDRYNTYQATYPYSTIADLPDLIDWFDDIHEKTPRYIEMIEDGDATSPNLVYNSTGSYTISFNYDYSVIRDITNSITINYYTFDGPDTIEYVRRSSQYVWSISSAEQSAHTATASCTYTQAMDWGDYDQIRLNSSNWSQYTLFKNFIRDYAIEDVPVYLG